VVTNLFVSVSPLTSNAYPHWYKCTQVNTTLRPLVSPQGDVSPRLGTPVLIYRIHWFSNWLVVSLFRVSKYNIRVVFYYRIKLQSWVVEKSKYYERVVAMQKSLICVHLIKYNLNLKSLLLKSYKVNNE